ncbi:hypothetical protein EON63_12040 [archaeon]|nr:MAG: hypothetical protein EON63_12040 [archaeon]
MAGAAIEALYGAHLTIGPPLSTGFYYDSYMGAHTISDEDLKKIEAKAGELSAQKHSFLRMVISKEQALEMFKHNPFKCSLIATKVGAWCCVRCLENYGIWCMVYGIWYIAI